MAAFEHLSQEVTCQHCDKLYTDPKLLPCLHVFCRDCLSVKGGPRDKEGLKFAVDCPLCSEVTEVSCFVYSTQTHNSCIILFQYRGKKNR